MGIVDRLLTFLVGVLSGASVPVFMVRYNDLWTRHREAQAAARILLGDLASVRKGFESVSVRSRNGDMLRELGPTYFRDTVTWITEGLDCFSPHMEKRCGLRDSDLEKKLEEELRKWVKFRDGLADEVPSHKRYKENNSGDRTPWWRLTSRSSRWRATISRSSTTCERPSPSLRSLRGLER